MKKVIQSIAQSITVIVVIICSLILWTSAKNNGGFSDATSILVNKQYNDNISSEQDVDYYKFSLSRPGSVNITFKHKKLDVYDGAFEEHWHGTLFTSSEKEICSFSFKGQDTVTTTTNVGLDKGTYYLMISGGYSFSENEPKLFDSTNYSLTVNYVASNYWEKEGSYDSYYFATNIELNKQYAGTFSLIDDYYRVSSDHDVFKNTTEKGDRYDGLCNADKDYYHFILPQAGFISISLDYANEYHYGRYELFRTRVFDDEYYLFDYSFSAKTSGSTESESFSVGLNKGEYWIRLEPVDELDSRDYKIKLNFTPSNNWERELNDSYDAATKAGLNAPYYGSITERSDKDYYKLNLSAKVNATLLFGNAPTYTLGYKQSDKWYMQIFDSNSNYVTDLSLAPWETKSVDLTLDKGTYYIEISSAEYQIDGDPYYFMFKQKVNVSCPADLKASSRSTSSIKLSWSKVNGVNGYIVYKYNTSKNKYSKIAATKDTSYVVKKLSAGTKYTYAVRAYKKVSGTNFYSAYSPL